MLTRSASAAAAATAATPTLVARRVGLVDDDLATTKLGAVQLCDGTFRHLGIGQLDKCEAAGTSGFAIGDDLDLSYRARTRLLKKS